MVPRVVVPAARPSAMRGRRRRESGASYPPGAYHAGGRVGRHVPRTAAGLCRHRPVPLSCSAGHERQRQAPACWPATLAPRWGAPGEDRARHTRVGQARTPCPCGVPTPGVRHVINCPQRRQHPSGRRGRRPRWARGARFGARAGGTRGAPSGRPPGRRSRRVRQLRLRRERTMPGGGLRRGHRSAQRVRQRAPGCRRPVPAHHPQVRAGPYHRGRFPAMSTRRRRGVHPPHHRRHEPAGGCAPARHRDGGVRQRAPRRAVAVASPDPAADPGQPGGGRPFGGRGTAGTAAG